MPELNEKRNAGKRKSPRGIAISDLIFSVCMKSSGPIFSLILDLCIPAGSAIADITHGNGVFCKVADIAKRHVRKNHSYFLALIQR